MERFIICGGARLHVEESGSGGPLLILHGNGEDIESMRPQIEFFSKHFRVIAVDSRGHGRSTRGRGELNFHRLAADVMGVLDGLEIERADILGFSDGGNIAIQAAISYPGCVSSLVLSGANTHPGGMTKRVLRAVTAGYRVYGALSPFSNRAAVKAELYGLMARNPCFTHDELASITARTLVTAGDRDMIRAEHTAYLARAIKNSALHIFPDAGHFIHLRRPEEYNGVVLNFLLGK